jgi:membrane protein DedA with SNARE-associated domain
VGLTAVRLKRVRSAIERRGRVALAVGRATPGLRTLTVVAAATSGARATVALPAVVAGSAVFLGGHVILGYVAGSAAREFIHRATGPAILVAAVLVLGAAVVWLVRRGRRGAAGAFAESACPACVMLGAVAMRSGVDAVGAEEKT